MTDLQRTDEWFADKCGNMGCSPLDTLMIKKRPSATRETLIAEKVAERLTGRFIQGFKSAAMENGELTEKEGLGRYAFERDVSITAVGFIRHPTIVGFGASCDGLIGDEGEGLIELKCPQIKQHIATLMGGKIAQGYIYQMQGQMSVTGRHWCDWVSYNPDLPLDMQIVIRRIDRDDSMIADLEREVGIFLKEVERAEDRLRALYLDHEEAA